MTYNARLAAQKTAQEKKQRRAHQKYMAEVRRNGKAIPSKRMPESPISRLKRHLDIWTFTAADDILAAYRASAGILSARDPDMDVPPPPPRPDAADDFAAHQSDLMRCYQQWRTDLAGTKGLLVTQQVLFMERSLRAIDTAQRTRKDTAVKFLIVTLRHFAALRGNVPRGAGSWRLTLKQPTTAKEAA